MSHCTTCATCARLPLRLRGPAAVAEFARACEVDGVATGPGVLVIALDDEFWTDGFSVSYDSSAYLDLSVDDLLRVADVLDTDMLVLAEIRSGKPDVPDTDEISTFRTLVRECRPDLLLLDCIVVTDHDHWSIDKLWRGNTTVSEDFSENSGNRHRWAL